MNILLVDDEPEIRHLYGEMLEICGCTVETARDGAEAVSRAAADDYDLVVMDLHMPKMDGFESIARLRKANRHTPVIVITGYYPEDVVASRLRKMDLAVEQTLMKPVTFSALWRAVTHLGSAGGPPQPN